MTKHSTDKDYATQCDQADPLRGWREHFHVPRKDGREVHYFCGNSLGLQPKTTRAVVDAELEHWEKLGVRGHVFKDEPWMSYHDVLVPGTAKVVGARESEVVNMNSLTANLHFLMVSFYRPKGQRTKILMEAGAFPSDQYAVQSQIAYHGLPAEDHLIELKPREGETTLRTEDVEAAIAREGNTLALVLMGGVQYFTGQAFDIARITKAAHDAGAYAGWDLAHAVGNLPLKLHDWGVDFAVWCSYKYLNAGPGALAGAFVHDDRAKEEPVRFAGWWGQDAKRRFLMEPTFHATPGAQGWALSNPPILQAAALKASLTIFSEVGMPRLREKSLKLTGYLEYLVKGLDSAKVHLITPIDPEARGAQLSLRVRGDAQKLAERLWDEGVVVDVRRPDVIRVSPAPLYNSFTNVHAFHGALKKVLAS